MVQQIGLLLALSVPARPQGPDAEVREVVVPTPDHDRARKLVRRIGVVGASASSGFGTGLPTAMVVHGALRTRERVMDVSTVRHFVDPIGIGRTQVEKILARKPTVVFAADFLFWFAAGGKGLQMRLADLDIAFDLLERFDCPVFVGDIPDVHGADERMIAPWQIPEEVDRAILNDAIRQWADADPDRHVVPLAGWYHVARNGGTVAIDGVDWTISAGQPLRRDNLHPNRLGQVMLGLLVLQELDAAYPGLAPKELRLDPVRLWRLHAPFTRRPRRG